MEFKLLFLDLDYSSQNRLRNEILSCAQLEDITLKEVDLKGAKQAENTFVIEGQHYQKTDWAYLLKALKSRLFLLEQENYLSAHFFGFKKEGEKLLAPNELSHTVESSTYCDGGEYLGVSFCTKVDQFKKWEQFERYKESLFCWAPLLESHESLNKFKSCSFLDRDGVLNIDHGYVGDLKSLDFDPRAFELVNLLNDKNKEIVVVTNQSGVSRGYFDLQAVRVVNEKIREEVLKKTNIDLKFWTVCPFHPDGVKKEFQKSSFLRKPKPGMFLEACDQYEVSLVNSFMIGDKPTDRVQGLDLLSFIKKSSTISSTKSKNFRNNSKWNNFAEVFEWDDYEDLLMKIQNFLNTQNK